MSMPVGSIIHSGRFATLPPKRTSVTKKNNGSAPPVDGEPLRTSVQKSVERFIADLSGQRIIGLYDFVIEEVEQPLLQTVMAHAENNQSRAAAMLGMSRGTLRKKLREHGMWENTNR